MEKPSSKDQHRQEVLAFLQKHISQSIFEISLPPLGTGHETYIASGSRKSYFVKLDAAIERYRLMSDYGLSPQVIIVGNLEDGTSIMVQQYHIGRKPSLSDFHLNFKKFAHHIRDMHQNQKLQNLLPQRDSNSYRQAAKDILNQVALRWKKYKRLVPASVDYVDEKIGILEEWISHLEGCGLVASHNDVCNANWLVTRDERIYLLDLDSMSLDDPAMDIGAILWWYYPPSMRQEFIANTGYENDEDFRNRMRIRMAIHNLNIILPREQSFDRFSPEDFEDALVDFRAVMEGRENPQGFID
jgi:hypothetical protein